MINFEEELKNYKPMPVVKEAEREISERRTVDVTDIIADLLLRQDRQSMEQGKAKRTQDKQVQILPAVEKETL